MELEKKIEGLLFYKGEPITIKKLAELLKSSVEKVENAISQLEISLEGRGITLLKKDGSIMMGVTKELGDLIESIRKDEITKDLSKATLETLSIILYRNGSTRSEIDFIRGVNSSFIIRNLLIRGLIEREQDPNDSRRIIYKPTFDVLSFMGVKSIEELPNYSQTNRELEDTLKNNINE